MKTIYADETEPDMKSGISKAWKWDDKAVAEKYGYDMSEFAVLRTWVIFAPWAHPHWSYYVLSLVHLRPIKGKPALIYKPGATHEIVLTALNPDVRVALNDNLRLLHPMNFAAQIVMDGKYPDHCAVEHNDEDAIRLIDATVQDVINGVLNPDTDYAQHWIARFGSSMVKGDPKTAGETKIIINMGTEEEKTIIIPPVPAPENKEDA